MATSSEGLTVISKGELRLLTEDSDGKGTQGEKACGTSELKGNISRAHQGRGCPKTVSV